MNSEFMICQAMFGSGVRIGTAVIAVIHRLILPVQAVALIAFCVVVAGTSVRGIVASLFVHTTVLSTAVTAASA